MDTNNFISGEKIQGLCDCSIYTKDYLSSYPNILSFCKKLIIIGEPIGSQQVKIIKESTSFFIKTDWLEYFSYNIFPLITTNFILITHNSDLPSGPINTLQTKIYNSPFLLKWYGQNMIPCEKGQCLPIGLENSQWKGSDYSWCNQNKNNNKSYLLYFNFNLNTHPSREAIREIVIANGFHQNDKKDWREYIYELSTHKFCISPPGNGIDCHRHWECIYVGCIPIVLKKDNDPIYNYFKHLPILFVDCYNDITPEFLNLQYELFKNKKFNLDYTKLDFWKNEFKCFNNCSSMRLSTVLASVNNNPEYYKFIPKQILFWGNFNIKFIAIFVGSTLPDFLIPYSDNIILWNKNLDINTAFVAQNVRIYYPSLIELPENEMLMITDMDMLPSNDTYYKNDLDKYSQHHFIYYRHIDGNQIYMCYNAAHPNIWSKVFSIFNNKNIEDKIYETYNKAYNGIPGETGWFIDQEIMYNALINYEHLVILNRPIKRLEMDNFKNIIASGINDKFIHHFDDMHFHRSYSNNEQLILYAEKQLSL
jgi:hypothetical protein